MLFSMYDTYKIRRYKHEHNSSVQNISWLVTYVATGLTELKTRYYLSWSYTVTKYMIPKTLLSFSKSYTFDFIRINWLMLIVDCDILIYTNNYYYLSWCRHTQAHVSANSRKCPKDIWNTRNQLKFLNYQDRFTEGLVEMWSRSGNLTRWFDKLSVQAFAENMHFDSF